MNRILAVCGVIALVACGRDDGPTATRPRFANDITAAACTGGKSQATTTWQVTGDWKAIFVGTGTVAKATSTPVTGATAATSGCVFTKGDRVYAILFPITVAADADVTQTVVMP